MFRRLSRHACACRYRKLFSKILENSRVARRSMCGCGDGSGADCGARPPPDRAARRTQRVTLADQPWRYARAHNRNIANRQIIQNRRYPPTSLPAAAAPTATVAIGRQAEADETSQKRTFAEPVSGSQIACSMMSAPGGTASPFALRTEPDRCVSLIRIANARCRTLPCPVESFSEI